MSKLLEDEKVAALVEKTSAKAAKEATKAAVAATNEAFEELVAEYEDDRDAVKVLKQAKKLVVGQIKA